MKNNILGNILALIILSPILFLTVGIICVTVQKPTRVLSSLLRLDIRVNDPIYILALLLFLLALIILTLLEAICWFIAYRRIIDELF
jgi:hypothetical protein